MQDLQGFDVSLLNNVLYLKGIFEQNEIKKIFCDNVRVLNDNDVKIKHEFGNYVVVSKNGKTYNTFQIKQQDENNVTFLNETNNLLITCKYETIIQDVIPNYSFFTKKNLISLILEFHNKFSYEIKSNLNMYTNILSQTIILTSQLPYILKNVTNLRISFQNQETIARQAMKTSADNSNLNDIGLPVDLGEIEELNPKSKLYLPLEKSQLTILNEKFIYNLGQQYCSLERSVKVEKGNIYPSVVSITDENDFPFSTTNVSLYKKDSIFTLNMGKYPSISFETKFNKDTVELTIKSNMEKYPFILIVKGYELEGDYEIKVKNKLTTQKLNLKKDDN